MPYFCIYARRCQRNWAYSRTSLSSICSHSYSLSNYPIVVDWKELIRFRKASKQDLGPQCEAPKKRGCLSDLCNILSPPDGGSTRSRVSVKRGSDFYRQTSLSLAGAAPTGSFIFVQTGPTNALLPWCSTDTPRVASGYASCPSSCIPVIPGYISILTGPAYRSE